MDVATCNMENLLTHGEQNIYMQGILDLFDLLIPPTVAVVLETFCTRAALSLGKRHYLI